MLTRSRPTIVSNDTLLDEKRVPAALHLPFGQLFFGYQVQKLDVPVSEHAGPADAPDAPPPDAPFQGTGHSLTRRPEVIEIDDA